MSAHNRAFNKNMQLQIKRILQESNFAIFFLLLLRDLLHKDV